MKYIISYCSGGLGNRLLPLSSCFELSDTLGRTVGIVWNKTDSCYASFNSLFKNEIVQINLNDLDPEDVSIYSNQDYILGDYNLNKNAALYDLYRKVGTKELSRLDEIYQDEKKYIIVYDNHFFLNLTNIEKLLSLLEPVTSIVQEVENFSEAKKINKATLGIHARGTDFRTEKLDGYITAIDKFVKTNPEINVLFCSDSVKWESKIAKKFPGNVIVRRKKGYIKKNNIFFDWADNFHRSEDSVIEGIVDIYLLACTNFVIYNKQSTFAQLVNHLISMKGK